MKRVQFLCSYRSQMAETFANARLGDRLQASSTGTDLVGYARPAAIQVLVEIDIRLQVAPKPVDYLKNMAFDIVITLYDDTAGKVIHFSSQISQN